MTYRTIFYLFFILSGSWLPASGQKDWSLKSDKDGISIFTKDLTDSKFKAIRVECELPASLTQLVAVLMDVNTAPQWVYATKSCVLLKQVSPSELYYYSEISVPWPASNRDFIARLIASQDPKTKVVTILGPTYPDYLPAKKDIVRVSQSEGKWVLKPVAKNRVKVEYTLHADPGGNIPAWLVNMFATRGPYESFRNLKEQLKKAVYVNAKLSYITD